MKIDIGKAKEQASEVPGNPSPQSDGGQKANQNAGARQGRAQIRPKKTIKRIPVVEMPLLKRGTTSNGINEPNKIVTRRLKRNRIVAVILLLLAIGAAAYYLAFGLGLANSSSDTPSATAEIDIIDFETKTNSGVDGAKATIEAYYSLLQQQDADGLRNYGFEDAAAAANMKWLSAINYQVDASLVVPDVETMPEPVGTYAGNDLYRIGDFMTSSPREVIHSTITGTTGCEGWVYYDAEKMSWVLIDPTIPTATQAAEAGNVVSQTEDGLVDVVLQCSGAYSNPWWSFAMLSVDITSADTENAVSVEERALDEGMTIAIPDSLLNGCRTAQRVAVSQPDGSQGDVEQFAASSISTAQAKGICSIYRGVLSDFAIDRIGAAPLRIDGNVCPVVISVGEEEITPAFAIGTASSEDILRLLNEEEREKYGASEENVAAARNELDMLASTASGYSEDEIQ